MSLTQLFQRFSNFFSPSNNFSLLIKASLNYSRLRQNLFLSQFSQVLQTSNQ